MAARRSACNTVILADSVSQTPLKDLPKPPNSPDSPMPPIDSDGPYCSSAIYHEDVATYKFPIGADLTVMQTTYDNDGERSVNVGIAGEIRLRKLPKGSSTGNQAYITVDVNVSDQNLRVIKTWDHETRILKVATPQYARFGSGQPHCVSLEITAWFPEHAELTDLLIEAIHLNLRVAEDIKMSVSGQSKFASLNGHVAFPSISLLGLGTEFSTPSETSQFIDLDEGGSSSGLAAQVNIPFSSRRIVVETLSGSITGCYPLMDFLGVTSQSGSVKINVFPQPVLPSAPAAAELVIDTIAGSIEVNLPVRDAVYPTSLPEITRLVFNVAQVASKDHITLGLLAISGPLLAAFTSPRCQSCLRVVLTSPGAPQIPSKPILFMEVSRSMSWIPSLSPWSRMWMKDQSAILIRISIFPSGMMILTSLSRQVWIGRCSKWTNQRCPGNTVSETSTPSMVHNMAPSDSNIPRFGKAHCMPKH
jgi:hypothetical protein